MASASPAGQAAASTALCFWSSARTLTSASRSSELFDAAPSVPRPTGIPAARAAAVRKRAPTASFMFETGLVTTVAPRCRDQLELGVVEPDAVREDRARAEQPERSRYSAGRTPCARDAVVDLVLGLGEVDLHRDARRSRTPRRSTASDGSLTV